MPQIPRQFLLPSLLLSLFVPAFSAAAASLVIDDFNYSTTTAARSAWANSYSPAVSMTTGGEWGADQVMLLNCDFLTRNTRCYWDRTVSLNLAAYIEFELEVYAPDPGAISGFTLYFRSGSGWYGASASLQKTGWQTLRFEVGNFIPEGTPAGWNQITGIRLSPWKAASRNTYLAVRQLRVVTPTVLLVRDTQTTNPEVVQQTIDRHLSWLGGYNIQCGVITRPGVEAGLLQGCRLAVLPYNENVSEAEMVQYESFVAGGGKLMVYYQLPGRLASLLGVRVASWTQGNYAAWLFSDPLIPGLPPRVLQASWNIMVAQTNGTHNARVTARWENGQGQNTAQAAWIAGDNGFYSSHILLGDDADPKSFALLCLIGSVVPEVWATAADGAIGAMGNVGAYQDYSRAVSGIRSQAATTLRAPLVEMELAGAETNRLDALAHRVANRFSEAIFAAHAARARLRSAYLLSFKPVDEEFRAIWEHHATGPYPGNWAAGIAALATNQFNAVFPNMLWGGLAHYNSAFLPHSAEFNQYGDQIAACVNAAHARGIQVHVWKVNYNLYGAPQSFIDGLRAANRTQVSSIGGATDWLCPSHPDNFALETNSLIEIVRNYNVDGIHFDYIRYPDADHCYCSGCASRFQAQTGRTVTNWPADVLASGSLRNAFLEWRRAQITRLVQTVYAQSKALKPAVKISAAVWPDPSSAYDGVGQDWRLWVTNGILDFVCPMDYTTGFASFKSLVGQQLEYVNGRVPVYPGIGAFILENDGTAAQIQATREANTRGFIVFELSSGSAESLLPALGSGLTAPDEPDTDNDLLPDSWENRWAGNLGKMNFDSDSDLDGISDRVEYIAGLDPSTFSQPVSPQVRLIAGQVEVSFLARGIDAVGYRNAARHYRLETTALPGPNADWAAVPGFEDYLASQGVSTISCGTEPVPGGARFYRLKVWLQQR